MRITFRTFLDGVNLAIAQIKKEPFFYIFSFLIGMVAASVVGFVFSLARQFLFIIISTHVCNPAVSIGIIFGSQILYYLILYLFIFPFHIGLFKCIKKSVNGEKPLVWMLIAEYRNIFSYFIPALIYTVTITLCMLIVMIPVFSLISFGRVISPPWSLLLLFGILIVIILLILAIALYLAPVFALLNYDIAEGRINPRKLNEILGEFKTFSLPMMFLTLLSSLLASIGIIACCIGVLVTAPAGMIVMWHLCRVFRGDAVRNDAVAESGENRTAG